MTYTNPVSGTGDGQTVSMSAHEAAVNATIAAGDAALLAIASAGDPVRLSYVSGDGQAATYEVVAAQAALTLGVGQPLQFAWQGANTATDPTLTIGATTYTLRAADGGALAADDLRASSYFARIHTVSPAVIRVLTLTRIADVPGLGAALDDAVQDAAEAQNTADDAAAAAAVADGKAVDAQATADDAVQDAAEAQNTADDAAAAAAAADAKVDAVSVVTSEPVFLEGYPGRQITVLVAFGDDVVPLIDDEGRALLVDPATGLVEPAPLAAERAAETAGALLAVTDDQPVFIDGERMSLVMQAGDDAVPILNEAGRLVRLDPDTGIMIVVGEDDASIRAIDLLTTPCIAWLSNSLAHGAYNLPGKFWLQILNGLTDWPIRNLSYFGFEAEDGLNDLIENTPHGNGVFGLRDLAPEYVVIGDTSNSTWRARNTDDYVASVERLMLAIRAIGAVPVIQTEPRNHPVEVLAALADLARRHGVPLVDVSSARKVVGGDLPTDYNQGGISSGVDFTHPGTRTQWVLTEALRRAVNALPRPAAALKIWRSRDTGAALDALTYDDHWGRHDRWLPLPVACRDLASGSYVNFDQLQNATTFAWVYDGHLDLAAGEAQAFVNHCLITAVVDGTSATLDQVVIDTGVTDGDVTAYVRSLLDPLGYDPNNVSQWTVVEVAALPTITAGATYANGFETLTYVGSATAPDGKLLTVWQPSVTTVRGALTYTLQTGAGDASFAGLWQGPGRPQVFYDNLLAPRAVWLPVTMTAGIVVLTGQDQLAAAMDGDRIDLLLVKAGTITLTTSPVLRWTEARVAKRLPSPPQIEARGTVLEDWLADNVVWDVVDADGASLGAAVSGAPDDGWVPPGVTVVAEVGNDARLTAVVDLEPDAVDSGWAVVEVWARHAPAKFTGVSFPGASEITLTSLDHRQLAVRLTEAAGDGRVHHEAVERIGLAWWRARYRIAVPPAPLWGAAARRLEIYSPDGVVLVGRVRIIKEA